MILAGRESRENTAGKDGMAQATHVAEGPGEIVRGLSGEAASVIRRPDLDAVKADLERLHHEEYRSLAIVLFHSYLHLSRLRAIHRRLIL